MKLPPLLFRLLVAAAVLAMPMVSAAQSGDLTHQHPATAGAKVDFGVLPTGPLGPLPCLQTGAIGGPGDPCSYKLHNLTPEEVTVFKGSEVTFQIHGGGHAFAIYEVSKDTTRDGIGEFLCPGTDPATIDDPTQHVCGPAAPVPINVTNAAAQHVVRDGHDDIVIVAAPAGPAPNNRVWYVPGRLMSADLPTFLNGGTIPAGPTSNGETFTYQFLKTGRYLVLCINRSHFLNDWMFGFVNVTGE